MRDGTFQLVATVIKFLTWDVKRQVLKFPYQGSTQPIMSGADVRVGSFSAGLDKWVEHNFYNTASTSLRINGRTD